MTGLRERYLEAASGDAALAAALIAKGLMRGDPDTFKAGYTRPNALMTAFEVLARDAVDRERTAEILAVIQPDPPGGYKSEPPDTAPTAVTP
jgi:hypothetical protein